jgi:arylsulfatase A-like enzyme
LLAILVLASAAACSGAPEEAPTADRPNVLLIVVDTLRADKLGCFGSDLAATPRIDALAAESVRFENAYSHAPWTLPSFASLLTSLYPPQHGAGGFIQNFSKLADDRQTIGESFGAAGYETASVVNVDFLTAAFGLTQGFDHVDFEVYPDNVRVRTATRTTDAALTWLGTRRARPFFLLVHYFDPHMIYSPPREFRAEFAAPEDRDAGGWIFGTRAQIVAQHEGRVRFDEATVRRAERLYDGEVAYTDHEVGRLLDALDGLGLREETIVVFTADHGEEFWDHGGIAHGHTIYEEQVHVPLLFSWPGRIAPGTVQAAVGHVDVAPTLCDLAGIETDPRFAGKSLAGGLAGQAMADRPVLQMGNFWGPPIVGWRRDGHKLIVWPDERLELFDLRTDPGETDNLDSREPERVAALLEELRFTLRGLGGEDRDDGTAPELTPEQIERLRSLGYVQ